MNRHARLTHLMPLALLVAVTSAASLWAQSVSMTVTLTIDDSTAPTATIASINRDIRSTVPYPIQITFSEPVLRLGVNDFVLTREGSPVSLATAGLSQISTLVYELDLGNIPTTDGNYVLTLPSSSDVTDRVQLPLAADASTAWRMTTTPPAFASAATADTDADGRIDRIEVVFDKIIRDTSLDAADFSVAGWTLLGVSSGTAVDDERILLLLAEAGSADTDTTPNISYQANGSTDLSDYYGNLLADSSITANDAAGPALVAASTRTPTSVALTFSEAIDETSLATSDFVFSGFATTAVNTVPASWSTGDTAGDAIIWLEFASSIDEDETGQVALGASAVLADCQNQPSAQTGTIPVSDGIDSGPALVSATTADVNGDGFLDQLVLRFAAAVDIADGDTANGLSGLSISGYTVSPADYALSADTILILSLQPSGVPDTGVTPRLDWSMAGTVRDAITGARSADVQNLLSLDGAAPVLLAATGRLYYSSLTLGFSEPVQALAGSISANDFLYGNNSGNGNGGLVGISDADGSDAELVLTANRALIFDDFNIDSMGVIAGNLSDAAGNTTSGLEQTILEQDAKPGLDPIADQSIDEDSGLLGITLTGLRPSCQGSSIQVQSSSSDSGLVPPPQLSNYDADNQTAWLQLSPARNANGSAVLRLRVSDDTGAWIERSFTVTVTFSNDPPRMDALADMELIEDSTTVDISITGLAPGPANEAHQSLSLRATSLATSRIRNLRLSYTAGEAVATLSLTPEPDATGDAMIVVTAQDDAGGNDSISRSFTVSLLPVDDAPRLQRNYGLTLAISESRTIGANRLSAWDDGALDQLSYIVTSLPTSGDIRRDGSVLVANDRFTQTDIEAGLIDYRHTASLPVEDGFNFALEDGGGLSGGTNHYITIQVVDPGSTSNQAPVVTLASTTLSWQEGDAPIRLDPEMGVTDADDDLSQGTGIIEITAGAKTGDTLSLIETEGLRLDADELLLDGNVVGNYVTSSTPPRLMLLFGENVTPAMAQRLLQQVAYQHVGNNPLSQTRTVQVLLKDGDGSTSAAVSRPIAVQDVDSPPQLSFPGPCAIYAEGAAPVLLDATATLSDPDSNSLSGGQLRLSWSNGAASGDQLGIDPAGGPEGRVALVAGSVTVDTTPVATLSGGTETNDLVLDLAAEATPSRIQVALRAIAYSSSADEPAAGTRELLASISDAQGGTGQANTTVLVSAVNDPPLLVIPTSDLNYDENDPPLALAETAQVSDSDSSNFTDGLLRVRISSGRGDGDRLSIATTNTIQTTTDGGISIDGSRIGTISQDASSIAILFDTEVTADTVAQVARALRYDNPSAAPLASTRTLAYQLSDGDGGTSAEITRNLIVSDSNAPPVITLATTNLSFVEDAGVTPLFTDASISDSDSADFDTGLLSVGLVSGTLSEDQLQLRSGNGVGIESGYVLVDGVAIASGPAQADASGLLRYELLLDATPARVTRLLQAIAFNNTSNTPDTSDRRIEALIADGDGDTSPVVALTLSVQATNDQPITNTIQIACLPGITISGQLPGKDVDGDILSWRALSTPSQGEFSLNTDGSYHYAAALNASGNDTINFVVSDGQADSATAQLLVNITDQVTERPQVISNPPAEARLDVEWVYSLNVDTTSLDVADADCDFLLYGDVPPGLVIQKLADGQAELRWLPGVTDRRVGLHYTFGVLFTENTTNTSGTVPVMVVIPNDGSTNQ